MSSENNQMENTSVEDVDKRTTTSIDVNVTADSQDTAVIGTVDGKSKYTFCFYFYT